ncbi:Eco57I restriction-modification methylase domain-containing protein [Helicobacter sp. MIT 21-1697]|uniref:type IIG restriction enzyme/methyltransferase n=1 Tax=Helicobacter sp. MIT 21-1697 TaxID=2993733 RepID=UPI00224AF6F7|nr:Eco57I restriction-modification methylase domain-containing protein [Helicobacter sp. MIT 21-1697]MCX2716210.1 Eco57I restriction-modification methylase domain-containing protein [Helicobacter sp. MIT 21-1697]
MPLSFESLTPKDFFTSFDKDYAQTKTSGLEDFKEKVAQYLESFDKNKGQNEPAIVSNALAPFLKELGFHAQPSYKQQGRSEIDLALLKDSQVEILIEAKNPSNTAEMFSPNNPNCKALHECILYYFREREGNEQGLERNISLKYIIITDFTRFFVFNAREFERHFYKNKEILKLYKRLNEKGTLIDNQQDFYAELQKILEKQLNGGGAEENLAENSALKYTSFDLRNDKHFNLTHKLLQRDFLHNEFQRDANALNPRFYKELLHILGLKEYEKNSKITIECDSTQDTSFANHIALKLASHNKPSDFEVVMSHILLWLNRILFLKLIEANLLAFNEFDKALNFLSGAKIKSFKDLSHLFFEVLAKDYQNRTNDRGFNFLPYLNSSLFIKDEKLEILDIALLDDTLEIEVFQSTQSTYKAGSKCAFLVYLFDFLNAFDFGKKSNSCHIESEVRNISPQTPSEESYSNKELIQSSVLGAVFEKLNGYKEGSFYTPSFITSYMCRESLSKIVVEKFNAYNPAWNAKTLEDIEEEIHREKRKRTESSTHIKDKYKKLLQSIRICDPSVGSGHFLVSALSEMVNIYYKLGLLEIDCESLEIKDDEIYLKIDKENFAYKRPQSEQNKNHQIQKSLFELKKSIIENNLFGVDINPNSCNIARLRLWIELLKNAYYLNFTKDKDSKTHKLQTLPNIDINIKCGNSLVSNIDTNITLENFTQNLEARLAKTLEKSDLFLHQSLASEIQDTKKKAQGKFQEMSQNAQSYKNEHDKQSAQIHKQHYEEAYSYLCKLFLRNCDEYINFHQALKEFFYQYGYINLTELEPETQFHIESYVEYFDFHKSVNFERKALREISQKELENLLKLMQIYEDFQNQATFEWRFAFPEVLDSNGDFLGFDLVIGNPPYIKEADNKRLFDGTRHLRTYQGKMDIWYHFVGKGFDIAKNKGIVTFIATQNWTTNTGAKALRNVILREAKILNLIDFGSYMCFDSASIQTMIMEFQKLNSIPESYQINYAKIESKKPTDKHREAILKREPFEDNLYLEPSITPTQMQNKPLTFVDSKQEEVLNKILVGGKMFLEEKEVGAGICPSLDDLFIVKDIACFSKKEKRYIKEWHTGLSQKYSTCETDKFLIYMSAKNYKQKNLDDLPNLKQHFEPYKEILQKAKIQYKTPNKPYFFLHREREERFFIEGNEKIISQVRCEIPTFAYTKENFYGSRALFFIQTNRFDMKFLTGLLNSKLIAFWLKHNGKIQGSLYKVEKEPLMSIPIPKITKYNKPLCNKIITLVEEILALKAKDSHCNTSHLESQIDGLVYQLYKLDSKEIKIIERGNK